MATLTSDFHRAVRLHRAGNLKRAQALYQRVLDRDPRHGDAHYWKGVLLVDSGRPELGRQFIVRAIELNGPKPAYCVALGRMFLADDDPAAAAACFRQGLRAAPLEPSIYLDLSRALTRSSDLGNAALALEQAVALDPANPNAWCEYGTALYRQGSDRAATCYRNALTLAPQFAEAAYNLGVIHFEQDQLEEARARFEEAIALRPGYTLAHNNLGNVLYRFGMPRIATSHYRQALHADPSFARAHLNLGVTLLSLGELRTGFAEYEWRFKQPNAARRHPALPLWDGTPLNGRRILLYSDQGLGDAIQFIRYAKFVGGLGGIVVIECPKPLLRLLSSAAGIDSVVETGSPLPAVDTVAPLASLPYLLGTSLTDIPEPGPYLRIPETLIDSWRVSARAFRIGLAWSGNPLHTNDRNRSIPAGLVESLTTVPGTITLGLQKPVDLRVPCAVHLGSAVGDLADTAAIVSQLDLVITADTAIAHLAGALGKPAWVLLPFAPDWRWMWDRPDSPWYPTLRLFRQRRRGDWETVIAEVRAELEERVHSAL